MSNRRRKDRKRMTPSQLEALTQSLLAELNPTVRPKPPSLFNTVPPYPGYHRERKRKEKEEREKAAKGTRSNYE